MVATTTAPTLPPSPPPTPSRRRLTERRTARDVTSTFSLEQALLFDEETAKGGDSAIKALENITGIVFHEPRTALRSKL